MKNLLIYTEKNNIIRRTCDLLTVYRLPLLLSLSAVLITFIYALNQKYLFDWDACFRAFSALAGRDIIVKTLKGNVSSLLDIKEILTGYSDFYEARPGSLISYPPGQTFIIGIMSFISVNQFFISLFNVCCFMFLSIGIWKVGEKLEFPLIAKIVSWSAICLHPTIILTVWSMRRGIFEATIVCWCFIWLIEFYRKSELKYFFYLLIAVVYGFLYRETLALIALPTAIVFLPKLKNISWNLKKNRKLIYLSIAGVCIATTYTSFQFLLYSKGMLSIFDKPTAYVGELGGGPPSEFLTMYGYYKGQFAPEKYLGLNEEGLKKSGAPEVCRLAMARWSLPFFYKVVYLLSGIFVNPFSLLLLAIIVLKIKSVPYKVESSLIAGLSLLYFVMLAPMGGIPDFTTPIILGLAVLYGISLSLSFSFIPQKTLLIGYGFFCVNIAISIYFLVGFIVGNLEEYPPYYDYDETVKELLTREKNGKFGIGVPNYIVKNLAYSKLKYDKNNRMACYSIEGSRLPVNIIIKKTSYKRYSPILKYERNVPGIFYLVLRSKNEIKKWQNRLKKSSEVEEICLWDDNKSFVIKRHKRLFGGEYRPLYVMRINNE